MVSTYNDGLAMTFGKRNKYFVRFFQLTENICDLERQENVKTYEGKKYLTINKIY